AGQAPALQPDEMPKHITATVAIVVALLPSKPMIAQHSHQEHPPPHGSGAAAEHEHEKAQNLTCPMHPEVITDHPGNCPKCGMKLVPVHEQKSRTPNLEHRTSHARPTEAHQSHASHAAGEHEHEKMRMEMHSTID